jgi:uncharacterized protein YycO
MLKLKYLILSLLTPIQKWIQRIGYIENSFTVEDVDYMAALCQPGDILGSYETGRITSWFIKGEYDHIAMVTDDMMVIEAVGDKFVDGKNIGGVRKVRLKEWIWKKNHVFIMRHKTYGIGTKASKSYYTLLGMSYDYTFDRGNEKMYCSEIPYVCYHTHDQYFLSNVPATKEILPIDYLACTSLDLVWDTRRSLR